VSVAWEEESNQPAQDLFRQGVDRLCDSAFCVIEQAELLNESMLFTQELCLGACCEYIFTQPWKLLLIRSSCVLCCAVLCCAVLCCAVLCCACCRNERGYLVAMTGCDWSAEPVQLRNGSTIGVASWYSGRTLDSQGAHPWHEGVMGLGFVGVVGHLEEVAKTFLRPPS